MKVLILGGTGHIGGRLVQMLQSSGDIDVVRASRRAGRADGRSVQVDTLDTAALAETLAGIDCVVNCVAGSAEAISVGARSLADAALRAGRPRIVHLSSMAVYGHAAGIAREDTPLDPSLGWYARAKCEAEAHMAEFVQKGGDAFVFRPGCVAGPGSQLWVGRIGRWLRAGRLGDIAAAGDGWSNLVHVDDVCRAVESAIRMPKLERGPMPVYNIAAPDSPRWGEYFVDLAVAIKAVPVRSVSARRLKMDSLLFGPPLKILSKVPSLGKALPDAMPPSLVRLWSNMVRLDTMASRALGIHWSTYEQTVEDGARWFTAQ